MKTKNILKNLTCLVTVLMLTLSFALTVGAKKTNNIHSPKYDFTSSDGSHITNPHQNGKTTLMIFFTEDCVYSSQLISDLSKADWINPQKLSIVAIGHGITDNAQLKKYADTYAKGSNKINFCYCNDESFADFCTAVGISLENAIAVPVVFIIDNGGEIVDYTTGGISSSTVRETLSNYVKGLQLPKKIKISVKGTLDYKEAFDVLDLINEERAKAGLQPVKMDKTLLNDAMKRAEECLVFYDHQRPDGSTFNTVDTNYPNMSENIAMGYHNAKDVMTAWMNSPGHKANILNPNAKSVGIGVFYQTAQKSWTQEFSPQEPKTVATEIPNQTKIDTVSFLEDHLALKLSRSKEILSIGETDTIYAFIKPWEESNQQTLVDNSCLTYKTDNPKVATVSSLGVITPVEVGTTNITVSLNGSNQQAVVPITVYPEGQSHEPNTDSKPGIFKPVATSNDTSSSVQNKKPANTTASTQSTVSVVPSKSTNSVASKPASPVVSKPVETSKTTSSTASKSAESSKPTSSVVSKPAESSKSTDSVASKPEESSKSTGSVASKPTVSSKADSSAATIPETSSEKISNSEETEPSENSVSSEEITKTESETETEEVNDDTLTVGATEESKNKPISTTLIAIIAVSAIAIIVGAVGIFFILKKFR